jgi:hypothetical protein
MPERPARSGSVCEKAEAHGYCRHREYAGEPASRAPEALRLAPRFPGGHTPTALEFGFSASLSGEFGGKAPGLRDAQPARRENAAWAADRSAPRAQNNRSQASSPHDGSRGRTPLARAGTDRNIGLISRKVKKKGELVMAGLDPAIHDEMPQMSRRRMDYRVSHWPATLRVECRAVEHREGPARPLLNIRAGRSLRSPARICGPVMTKRAITLPQSSAAPACRSARR